MMITDNMTHEELSKNSQKFEFELSETQMVYYRAYSINIMFCTCII